MNKNEKITLYVVSATVIGLIVYLIILNQKRQKQINELESNHLRLQSFLFDKYGDSEKIKENHIVEGEISTLIKSYSDHPETVHTLYRVRELYSQGNFEEAIRKLVVIIENKMKLKLERDKDSWYLGLSDNKKRYLKFDRLIKRAKDLEWFDDLQLSVLNSSINIRHRESHQEGFKSGPTQAQICVLGSIEIIGVIAPFRGSASK